MGFVTISREPLSPFISYSPRGGRGPFPSRFKDLNFRFFST